MAIKSLFFSKKQRFNSITQRVIPIAIYLVEAEKLYKWSQQDKDKLVARKLDWRLVEDIPKRTNVLQEAESRWLAVRFNKNETVKLWQKQSQEAFYLRNLLIREFRFAYRKDTMLLGRVNVLAAEQTQAAMIQNLNDLSVLGNNNRSQLEAINFDFTLLSNAAKLATELKALLASRQLESDTNPVKQIRDRAFTYLKNAVDEVCIFGQHVFAEYQERKYGYVSEYLRRFRQKSAKKSALAAANVEDTPNNSASV